jgi:ATP-dependent Clp protease ATP-binding subunit ClpX
VSRLDSDAATCLHCGKVRSEGDPTWETHRLADTEVHLCGQHAAPFALGVTWSALDRRARDRAAWEAAAREDDGRRARHEERRRRVEARLARIGAFDMLPLQIHSELSRRVAGQDEAKRTLATAVRGHYRRGQMRMLEESDEHPPVRPDLLPKETVVLLGPTGCGKSFTCRTLSTIVDAPYWGDSLAKYTAEGWVGNSVEELLGALVSVSDSFVPLAEKGILFLDEVDKKAKRAAPGARDVGGEDLQFSLLQILETGGAKVFICPFVGGRRNPNQPLVEFDTRDVFFILGGAFVGLADIVGRRLGGRDRLGFGTPTDTPRDRQMRESELLHEALPCDLIEFGLIPELVGRCGSLAVFDPLSRGELRSILLDVDDAVVEQQRARAQLEGFSLEFADEAIDAICDRAYTSGMGARRLRSLTGEVLTRIFFDMPSGVCRGGRRPRVIVTAATVADPTAYEVVRATRATGGTVTRLRESGPGETDASAEAAERECST